MSDETTPKLTPVQIEEQVLKFWEEHKIFEKTLEKNQRQRTLCFF